MKEGLKKFHHRRVFTHLSYLICIHFLNTLFCRRCFIVCRCFIGVLRGLQNCLFPTPRIDVILWSFVDIFKSHIETDCANRKERRSPVRNCRTKLKCRICEYGTRACILNQLQMGLKQVSFTSLTYIHQPSIKTNIKKKNYNHQRFYTFLLL